MPPGTDRWSYIKVSTLPSMSFAHPDDPLKPLPGHIVCNVGDALSIFSGGILRSSVHRVMSVLASRIVPSNASFDLKHLQASTR